MSLADYFSVDQHYECCVITGIMYRTSPVISGHRRVAEVSCSGSQESLLIPALHYPFHIIHQKEEIGLNESKESGHEKLNRGNKINDNQRIVGRGETDKAHVNRS